MRLTLQTRVLEWVIVVSCQGRITAGDEVRGLQDVVDTVGHYKKKIVLHLAGVDYIDSAGLGTLIRLFRSLQVNGGGLKLCHLSPQVMHVLKTTHLHTVLPVYGTEREAVEAFSSWRQYGGEGHRTHHTPIVCIDSSSDVLAYVHALLTQAGYEVFTTRHMNDAKTLVSVIRPRILIFGPSANKTDSVIDKICRLVPDSHTFFLPHDFSTSDASHAGTALLNHIHSAAKP